MPEPGHDQSPADAAWPYRLARWLFFGVGVRALVLVFLGLAVRNRQRLPKQGPAIMAANHNSHLDTLVLMSLFPLRLLPKLRPVAAADYFFASKGMAWFSVYILGLIPVARGSAKDGGNPLEACEAALDRGEILILFPEGSRGEPEAIGQFKRGIGHLAKARPDVPVVPVFMHGLGKALPKGAHLIVPFNCIASIGETLHGDEDYAAFVDRLEAAMKGLAAEEKLPVWE